MQTLFRLCHMPSLLGMWVVLFVCHVSAFAAEWSLIPGFETRGQYNDNITLTTNPHSAVWGLWLNPSLQMRYATEIISLQILPEFEYVRYFSDDENDNTFVNFFLPFTGSYLTETDRFGLAAAVNRDNALISELEETGVVTDFLQRDTYTARGNWDRLLTERLTLLTSYQFYNVNYEKDRQSPLLDFQSHTGTFGPAYEWTEKTRLHSTFLYSFSRFHDIAFRTHSAGVEIGLSHGLFETLTVAGSGGGRHVVTTTRVDGRSQQDTNLVWLFSFSLDQQWERSNVVMGYSRTLNPNGNGVLLQTDRVNLHFGHEYTETITFALDGRLNLNDTIGSSSGSRRNVKSRYWQVSPSISWRFTEDWRFRLSYRYAKREIQRSSGGTVTSNSVNIGLTYTWPKWSVSR